MKIFTGISHEKWVWEILLMKYTHSVAIGGTYELTHDAQVHIIILANMVGLYGIITLVLFHY